MPKFRKKPIVIEAIQWTGDNIEEISKFINLFCDWQYRGDEKKLFFNTFEGEMTASINDWIVKEPFPTDDRKFYPCKPDIFGQTYDPA